MSELTIKLSAEPSQLHLSGVLNFDTAAKAWQQTQTLWLKANSLTLNLQAVSHADSAALAYLMAVMRLAKQKKMSLQIIHMPKALQDLAKVSGIESLLPLK
jgi:phospholipid transport system transporter-binding protein